MHGQHLPGSEKVHDERFVTSSRTKSLLKCEEREKTILNTQPYQVSTITNSSKSN